MIGITVTLSITFATCQLHADSRQVLRYGYQLRLCFCLLLCVRALKAKRLELSTPKLVQM